MRRSFMMPPGIIFGSSSDRPGRLGAGARGGLRSASSLRPDQHGGCAAETPGVLLSDRAGPHAAEMGTAEAGEFHLLRLNARFQSRIAAARVVIGKVWGMIGQPGGPVA